MTALIFTMPFMWAAGPAPGEVVSAVLRGGKRQKGGNVLYLGCLRDTEPMRCPQLGLALHLLHMFVIKKVHFQHSCRADWCFAISI